MQSSNPRTGPYLIEFLVLFSHESKVDQLFVLIQDNISPDSLGQFLAQDLGSGRVEIATEEPAVIILNFMETMW